MYVFSLWSSSQWTYSDEMEALLAFAGVPLRDEDCRAVSSLDFLPMACSSQGYAVKMRDLFPWASPWLSWFQFCRHAVVSSLWSYWGLASQQQWVKAKNLGPWPVLLLSHCALEFLFTSVLANQLFNTLGSCLWVCTSVNPWLHPLRLNALRRKEV